MRTDIDQLQVIGLADLQSANSGYTKPQPVANAKTYNAGPGTDLRDWETYDKHLKQQIKLEAAHKLPPGWTVHVSRSTNRSAFGHCAPIQPCVLHHLPSKL
jgi:hypothetical protein